MRLDLSSLNARHLEIFLVMMTSQRQSDAALRLGISEPAISKSIRVLEREAGVKFFTLSSGRLRATDEARRIFPFVQRAIHQLELAKQVVYGLHDLSWTRCEIAVGGAATSYLVPEAVRRVQAQLPRARMTVTSEHTDLIVRMVASRQVNIGIASSPAYDIDASAVELCETVTVSEDDLVAVVPRGDPLARNALLRASDLSGRPVVMLSDSSPTSQLIEATFRQAGAILRSSVVASNSIAACHLARCSVGVALVNPWSLAGGAFADLVALPFKPRITLRTCAYVPKLSELDPAAKGLLESFHTIVAERRDKAEVRALGTASSPRKTRQPAGGI